MELSALPMIICWFEFGYLIDEVEASSEASLMRSMLGEEIRASWSGRYLEKRERVFVYAFLFAPAAAAAAAGRLMITIHRIIHRAHARLPDGESLHPIDRSWHQMKN